MRREITGFVCGAVFGLVGPVWAQQTLPPPVIDDGQATADRAVLPSGETIEDVADVLTRGPVHEGFAEQVSADPQPGVIISREPPPPIAEIPPAARPEGDDVSWIPGYWFWDDERKDFMWVSGVWRRVPPGREWIPGYWHSVDGGYQWAAGYWNAVASGTPEYVEPPPASVEVGPSSPAPSTDDFWVPGSWLSVSGSFRWRPGFWHDYQPGWTWVCGRYVWTPGGCLYVRGYWDYPLVRRGCLFAPVRFRTAAYLRPGFRYRPCCWIGDTSLLLNLFVRPSCQHYYFGDYYGAPYQREYFSCARYYRSHLGYTPLYTYYQHYYRRQGVNYVTRVSNWHDYLGRHHDLRPAHTWHAERTRAGQAAFSGAHQHLVMGRDLLHAADHGLPGRRLQHVSSTSVDRFAAQAREIQQMAVARQRREAAFRRQIGEHDRPHAAMGKGHMAGPAKYTTPGVRTGSGLATKTGPTARPPAAVGKRHEAGRAKYTTPGVRTGSGLATKAGPTVRPRAADHYTINKKEPGVGHGPKGGHTGPATGPRAIAQTPRVLPGVSTPKTADRPTQSPRLAPPRQPTDASSLRDLLAKRRAEVQHEVDRALAQAKARAHTQEHARNTSPSNPSVPAVSKRRPEISQPGVPRSIAQTPRTFERVGKPNVSGPPAHSTRTMPSRQPSDVSSLRDLLAKRRAEAQHEVDRALARAKVPVRTQPSTHSTLPGIVSGRTVVSPPRTVTKPSFSRSGSIPTPTSHVPAARRPTFRQAPRSTPRPNFSVPSSRSLKGASPPVRTPPRASGGLPGISKPAPSHPTIRRGPSGASANRSRPTARSFSPRRSPNASGDHAGKARGRTLGKH